mgnify:CR=1 FL=1
MTTEQKIINKINAKANFTYPNVTKRYIVGKKLLHESKNPSLYYQNIYKDVYKFLNSDSKPNKTFGGWFNDETQTYCVDLGKSYNSLKKAVKIAKKYNQICIYDTLTGLTIDTAYISNIMQNIKRATGITINQI